MSLCIIFLNLHRFVSAMLRAISFSLILVLSSAYFTKAQKLDFVANSPIMGGINSQLEEQHPVVSPDGRFLYFTYRFHPQNIGGKKNAGDIWVSELDSEGKWQKPVHTGELWNDNGHNVLFKFFDRGQRVLLLVNDAQSGQSLAVSSFCESGWSAPETLFIRSFYNRSGHLSATISEDGAVLIISMQSIGSLGYEDLYISFREKDLVYSKPESLGSMLNTDMQEITPYLYQDSHLFFASNRPGGLGGKDIYLSQRQGQGWRNWSTPSNLGAGVNTSGSEFGFFVHEFHHLAYLAGMGNSLGMADLHQVEIKDRIFESLLAAESIYGVPKTSSEVVESVLSPPVLIAETFSESSLEVKKEVQTEQVANAAVELKMEEKKEELAEVTMQKSPPVKEIGDVRGTPSVADTQNPSGRAPEKVIAKDPLVSLVMFAGVLLDQESQKPVVGRILLSDGRTIDTDGEGSFSFNAEQGKAFTLTVNLPAYQPLMISSDNLAEQILLQPKSAFARLSGHKRLNAIPSKHGNIRENRLAKRTLHEVWFSSFQVLDETTRIPLQALVQIRSGNQTLAEGRADESGRFDYAARGKSMNAEIEIQLPGYKAYLSPLQAASRQIVLTPIGVSSIVPLSQLSIKAPVESFEVKTMKNKDIPSGMVIFTLQILADGNTDVIRFETASGEPVSSWLKNGEEWMLMLPEGQFPTKMKAVGKGYFSEWVDAEGWHSDANRILELKEIKTGANFILSRLEFEQGTVNFSDPSAQDELSRLADIMLNTPGLTIQLTGYTDNQGLARENMELSLSRANSVKEFLIDKGISADRIEARGLGSSNPIASNLNPETRKLNRRVECTVLSVGN